MGIITIRRFCLIVFSIVALPVYGFRMYGEVSILY